MGLVHADITLRNAKDISLEPMTVNALVDTGAFMLCIPESIASQLKLQRHDTRVVTTADGHTHEVPYVGPIQVTFGTRNSYTGAVVLGDEVLLGAIPMEDMDLIVSPLHQKLMVNPERPNIAGGLVKGFTSKNRSKTV